MKKQKQIVIGLGEVGTAIKSITKADGMDLFKNCDNNGGPYEVMHVCIPWGKNFVRSVKNYAKMFSPNLVIIHSSVPVGTCDKYGWVHSPVRGVHPELEAGIRTFVKFFGGKDAKKAAHVFKRLGIKTKTTEFAKNTEAAKLWDTTQHGIAIMVEKNIFAYCKRKKLDFDTVYSQFNRTYNTGYQDLNMPEYARPVLKHMKGKIGGHCVIPNAKILDSEIGKALIDANEMITQNW